MFLPEEGRPETSSSNKHQQKVFGFHSKNFRLDASSETLLIEGDPDLKYLNEINDRYGSKEFLVLTYTPQEKMIDDSSIVNLVKLKKEIQKLNWVHSVITLLDIPLLNSSDEPLIERLQNYSTLSSRGIDKEKGFNEIGLNKTGISDLGPKCGAGRFLS